ncbi:hypothetical protein PQX77_000552, partial [Marasmius sp. AFHP31]
TVSSPATSNGLRPAVAVVFSASRCLRAPKSRIGSPLLSQLSPCLASSSSPSSSRRFTRRSRMHAASALRVERARFPSPSPTLWRNVS